jgi:glycosyltransferase involved in cell wall biosynthesis
LAEVQLSVLVPCLDEERHIGAAIEGMRAQTFSGAVEFLFLDGGSTDATRAVLDAVAAGDERFRIFDDPGTNVPERLNLGLRRARGAIVARMDAHTVFPPAYLEAGVDRLRRGDVASVSGPQIAAGEGRWARRVTLALRSRLGTGAANFRRVPPGEIEVASGFCGVWPRALLVEHGGWDAEAASGEDYELAARLRRAGGRIVCIPAMAAAYMPRDDLRGLAAQYARYGYRRAAVARRRPEVLRRSHLLPPAVVLAAAAAALGRAPLARPARAALALYAAALAVESLRVGRDGGPGDAAALPAVFATMHLGWGAGFLAGCARHGPPVAALSRGPRSAPGGR